MKPLQFNWRRHWAAVVPHLSDPEVVAALETGLSEYKFCGHPLWKGEPPWEMGRAHQGTPQPGQLEWYQPHGRCHWIAPFAWAIGKKLFPELLWGFLTSEAHTVAIGLKKGKIQVVMDILCFHSNWPEDSIAAVQGDPWKICYTIQELFSSEDTQPPIESTRRRRHKLYRADEEQPMSEESV